MRIKWVTIILLLAVTAFADRPAQPNFVLILADDLGWQDVKCYDTEAPYSVFETPYMDALAEEGVMFRQAYSPSCVCAPSRAAILTGKHTARLGITSVAGGTCPQPLNPALRTIGAYTSLRLEDAETTIPEILGPNGYFNGHIGKWHIVGRNGHPNPFDQGFDWSRQNRGETTGMADRLTGFATTNAADPYQLDANGFAFDQTTQDALDFLSDAVATNKPFFCYYASYLVHTPIHMRTESLLIKYAGKMGYSYPLTGGEFFAVGQNNPYYAAMVETFDYNVHQIMTYLKDTDDSRWPGHKLIENTYIFITSDNGGMEWDQENITDNYPVDKGKIHQEEGGTRVPFIALGPGISTNVESQVMINGLDFFPTMLSLAGIPIPSGLDGCDLTPLLHTDPADGQLVTNQTGQVRDSMVWHFPHGHELTSTLRKDGWKLFLNYDDLDNASINPYRLYELYDTNGVRNDIEEMVDVWDADPVFTAQLAAELDARLEEMGALPANRNPNCTTTLTNQELVPGVLANGSTGGVVWVEFETHKAAVAEAALMYTLTGASAQEEWFRMPATMVSPGRVEAVVPEGTTHYVFNLIDENNYLVSYPDVGTSADGEYDSAYALPYVVLPYVDPGPQDTIFSEDFSSATLGTNLLRDSVGFCKGSSSAWMIDGGMLSNTSLVNSTVSEGAAAFILDLSTLPTNTVDRFTLSFDWTMAEPNELLCVHVWGYVDSSSTPTTSIMNLGAANGNAWENADPAYMTAYNFGNSNGVFNGTQGIVDDVAISFPGSYPATGYARTFDLSEWTAAPNTLNAYDYLVVGFARSFGGTAPAATIDNVKITVPTGDPYRQWVFDSGLEEGNLYDGLDSLQAATMLVRDDNGLRKVTDSAWTASEGVLSNSSTTDSRVAEGAIGRIINLSSISNTSLNQLGLSFDYTTADAAEKLYVHLWGYVDVSSSSGSLTMNLGGQNGNAWETQRLASIGDLTSYNLGKPDGVFTGNPGANADAAVILTGSTGAQSYSGTFDLSGFTTAPDTVSAYDYIAIGFAREITGASVPAATIENIVLSVPGAGGYELWSYKPELPDNDLLADPDLDGLKNLLEYALGGNPTLGNDIGILPTLGKGSGDMEYLYRRRRDAAARGLGYEVKAATNLVLAGWSTNGITETGAGVVDADFESVTNRIDTTGKISEFIRLKIEVL